MEGWISLHRQIQKGWLWEDKPFSRGQAWIDLLLEANYKNNIISIGNELIEVKRGQKVWSILDMSDRWGWSRKKVSNFLNLLQTDNKIEQKRTTKYTLVTIVNYNLYQDKEQRENNTGTSKEQQKNTNNKEKNNSCSSEATPLQKINKYFQDNFRLSGITPAESKKVIDWLEQGFEPDCIIYALEVAVLKDKRYLSYVDGILKNYETAGIKTRAIAEEYQRKWEAEKRAKASKKPANTDKNPKSSFSNFQNRKYDGNALEEKLLAKSKGELID